MSEMTRKKPGGGMELDKVNPPLPFDHFFFCFLPAEAAAGAYALISNATNV